MSKLCNECLAKRPIGHFRKRFEDDRRTGDNAFRQPYCLRCHPMYSNRRGYAPKLRRKAKALKIRLERVPGSVYRKFRIAPVGAFYEPGARAEIRAEVAAFNAPLEAEGLPIDRHGITLLEDPPEALEVIQMTFAFLAA